MTLRLSRLAASVGHSGTMAIDERMQSLRAQGRDILSLGAGQLDFDTPEPIASAGARAIADGQTRYTPVGGTAALRRAVRAKLERENGLAYGEDEVIVGAGAKGVTYHALLALLDPGDAVVIPTPAWPSYAAMVGLAGGRVLEARLEASHGYRLDVDALAAAVRDAGRARGVILNSPHNPTGAVYSAADYARLAELAEAEDLWVISDEIYEHLTYDGAFTSFAALPRMRERTVTVNGVSKTFAMTGWRIGYAGAPAPLVRAMEAIQSHTAGNPCSVSQAAAEAALRLSLDGDEAMRASRAAFREALLARRELAWRELSTMPGVVPVRPAGAFYVFADVSAHFGRRCGDRLIQGSTDLATALLEQAGVAAVPGAAFGDDRCLRISFATSIEELGAALQRIRRALT